MFELGLRKRFTASHWLVGGDWGKENQLHEHSYKLEWILSARDLDRHGYVADLLALETILESLISRVRDRVLNDLPEFSGLNPSLERFVFFLGQQSKEELRRLDIESRFVRQKLILWEHEDAWASWTEGEA